jgi:cytochrome c553
MGRILARRRKPPPPGFQAAGRAMASSRMFGARNDQPRLSMSQSSAPAGFAGKSAGGHDAAPAQELNEILWDRRAVAIRSRPKKFGSRLMPKTGASRADSHSRRRFVVKRKTVAALILAAGIAPGPGLAEPSAASPARNARILLTIPFEDREAMLGEMRTNLEQVRRLFVAYVGNDFEAIEKIADEISLHRKRAQVVVRRGNPTYTAMAVQFHAGNTMEIREAARAKDPQRVAAAINTALQACVACHAAWRLTEWPDNKVYARPDPVPLVLPEGAKILD